MGRLKFKQILTDVPGTDRVATCEPFKAGFIPPSIRVNLRYHDQSCAVQYSGFCWMPVVVAFHENLRADLQSIVADSMTQGMGDNTLTISTGPVKKCHYMLATKSCECITGVPLNVCANFRVRQRPLQNGFKQRAVALSGGGRDARHQLCRVMGQQLTGPEVESPVGRVESQRVCIKLTYLHRVAAIT